MIEILKTNYLLILIKLKYNCQWIILRVIIFRETNDPKSCNKAHGDGGDHEVTHKVTYGQLLLIGHRQLLAELNQTIRLQGR